MGFKWRIDMNGILNGQHNNYNGINKEDLLSFLINNPLNIINLTNPPISFDIEGNPISYWEDNQWDYSYVVKNKTQRCILNFAKYSNLTSYFITELKYLTLINYLTNYSKYRTPKVIKQMLFNNYPIIASVQLLGYATICELNEQLKFISVMEHIKGKYSFGTLEHILSNLKKTSDIEKPYFDFNINFPVYEARKKFSFNSKEIAAKYSKTGSAHTDQTLYIPNRIHSELIGASIDIVADKRKRLSNIMSLLEEEYLLYEKIKKDFDIVDVGTQRAISTIGNAKRDNMVHLLKKHDLSQFHTLANVKREVRLLAIACIVLILNFSGMRINELRNIKNDGFKTINSSPPLYVIRSYETKISGGQIVDYITSPIIKDCFEILQIIHSLAKKYDKSVEPNSLFISSKHQKLPGYGESNHIATQLSYFTKELNLIITEADIKESELLNGSREDIKVGSIWPLSSHQFRRTLIVNFVAHRLGTINAVKQQVKHMYATMTEYYAKNSRLAETFNLNVVKEISDIIEEELINEGVRQYKEFYYSEEPLAGIKGQEIMNERESIKVLSDDEIKQLFKTGLYKISKSMYGYCTKGNLCDKKEAIDPTFCGASCSTMIITKDNAQNWQKLYFRNKKVLKLNEPLMIAGVPMNGAKTTMQSQNEVAKKIMNQFNMKYED